LLQLAQQVLQRVARSLGHDAYAAILLVGNPAGQGEAQGLAAHEPTEPDALDRAPYGCFEPMNCFHAAAPPAGPERARGKASRSVSSSRSGLAYISSADAA